MKRQVKLERAVRPVWRIVLIKPATEHRGRELSSGGTASIREVGGGHWCDEILLRQVFHQQQVHYRASVRMSTVWYRPLGPFLMHWSVGLLTASLKRWEKRDELICLLIWLPALMCQHCTCDILRNVFGFHVSSRAALPNMLPEPAEAKRCGTCSHSNQERDRGRHDTSPHLPPSQPQPSPQSPPSRVSMNITDQTRTLRLNQTLRFSSYCCHPWR